MNWSINSMKVDIEQLGATNRARYCTRDRELWKDFVTAVHRPLMGPIEWKKKKNVLMIYTVRKVGNIFKNTHLFFWFSYEPLKSATAGNAWTVRPETFRMFRFYNFYYPRKIIQKRNRTLTINLNGFTKSINLDRRNFIEPLDRQFQLRHI